MDRPKKWFARRLVKRTILRSARKTDDDLTIAQDLVQRSQHPRMPSSASSRSSEPLLADALHIGYQKTATTWLQTDIIPALPDVAPLAKPALIDRGYRDVLDRICSDRDGTFDAGALRDRIGRIHESNGLTDHRKRLICYEHLCGELFSGWDTIRVLDRARNVFGPTKIIATIREQKSMVESLYRYYLQCGGSLDLADFLFRPSSPAVSNSGVPGWQIKFSYDRVMTYCQSLFGEENVRFLPFEWIRKDTCRFLKAYFGFFGVDVPASLADRDQARNEAMSFYGSSALRVLNQYRSTKYSDAPFARNLSPFFISLQTNVLAPVDRACFGSLGRAKRFVNQAVPDRPWIPAVWQEYASFAEAFDAFFAESNRNLVGYTGQLLHDFGYAT